MKQTFTFQLFIFCIFLLTAPCLYAQALVEGEPSVLKEDKPQSNYVYDLKLLIRKSKENIKSVNEKIKDQAVQKRNQQREDRAREYFEQARKLAEEGRLDESRQLYDKAINITEHPEMKYYIKESGVRAKRQKVALADEEVQQTRRTEEDEKATIERVQNAYDMAVSLYKQQRFKEAKEEFLVVDEMYPDYKAVRSYLQIIEQDIMQSEQQAIKDQRKEIDRQSRDAEIARLREKELWRKEIERKEKDRDLQVQKQAQEVYDQAVQLYQDRKYPEARQKFQDVELVVPDFKSTRSYLKRLEKDVEEDKARLAKEREKNVEKQRWDEALTAKREEEERKKGAEQREQAKVDQLKDQAEFVYKAAVALFNKAEYPPAREKFREIEQLYPDYKSTRSYLKKIDDRLMTPQEREEARLKAEEEKRLAKEAEAKRKEQEELNKKNQEVLNKSYLEAFDLYRVGRLAEAKQKFLELDKVAPDYKSTKTYLKKIDEDMDILALAKDSGDELLSQKQELERLKEIRDKADVIYNAAILAYDSKNFETAKAKFTEVDSVYPNYKKTVSYLNRLETDAARQDELMARQKLEADTEAIYVKAVNAYNSGDLDEAKQLFVDVATAIADYKQTSFYLERIDDDIIRKKEKTYIDTTSRQASIIYSQAVALYEGKEFELAKEKFLEVEAIATDYKDVEKYLATIDKDILRKKEEFEDRLKNEQTEELYKKAVVIYKSGDFAAARDAFVRVQVVNPSYKDVTKLLADIDQQVEQKKMEAAAAEAEGPYAEGVALFRTKDFSKAAKKFEQVELIYSDYKDTRNYLVRLAKENQESEQRSIKEEIQHQAEVVYPEAVKLYNDRQFKEAKGKFIAVAALIPDYKNVKSYLARIDKDINDQRFVDAKAAREAQAEKLYVEAIGLYQGKDFAAAREKFIAVRNVLPDYKKTEAYLAKLVKDFGLEMAPAPVAPIAFEDDDPVMGVYKEAVALFKEKKLSEAKVKFRQVENDAPGYRSTRNYIKMINESLGIKEEPVALERPVAKISSSEPVGAVGHLKETEKVLSQPKTPVKVEAPKVRKSSTEDLALKSDAEKLQLLSAQSKALYRQIKDLADDKDVAAVGRTFAKIDSIVARLEAEQNRLAKTIARQDGDGLKSAADVRQEQNVEFTVKKEATESKLRALKAKDEQKEVLEARERDIVKHKEVHIKARMERDRAREEQAKAEAVYQQGVGFFRAKEYGSAKDRFNEALKLSPGYKDAGQYLLRVERVEGQRKLLDKENADRVEISRLAAKADRINAEALVLTEKKDYVGIREKFSDLEELLKEIKVAKDRMIQRREQFANDWQARVVSVKQDVADKYPVKNKDVFSGKISREGAKQAFRDGEAFYAAGKYPEAKVKFLEALNLDSRLRAAKTYVDRIDRLLDKQDYQGQLDTVKKETRDLGRKEDQQQGLIPTGAIVPTLDVERARVVYEAGVDLYRAKRYKESRIKFEEVCTVGDVAQRDKAKRYLGLVETALENERIKLQQEKGDQERAYIDAKRSEVKLSTERDQAGRVQAFQERVEKFSKKSDLALQREIQLRTIEKENMAERQRILKDEVSQGKRANKTDNLEREKFAKMAQAQDMAVDKELSKALAKDVGVVEGNKTPAVKDAFEADRRAAEAESTRLARQALDEEKRILQGQRDAIRKDFEDGIERVYSQAVELYKKRFYDEARSSFNEVKGLMPDYKKTEYYLGQIEKEVLKKAPKVIAVPVTTKKAVAPVGPAADRTKAVVDMLDQLEKVTAQ